MVDGATGTGAFRILRGTEVKKDSKLKDDRQTMRVREEAYDYIVKQAERGYRTPPAQVELMTALHALLREEFGTDEPEAIRAKIQELKKTAASK